MNNDIKEDHLLPFYLSYWDIHNVIKFVSAANIIESYGSAWIIMKWCGENIRAWMEGISSFWSFWEGY